MLAIPAIDLCDGACVRLAQGDFSRRTEYSADPAGTAAAFAAAGATRIHVVDLDGARSGKPRNRTAIAAIARAAAEGDASIQLGGGLRTLDDIAAALDAGASQAILGSAAIRDFSLLEQACKAHPDRILLGLDARTGMLATEGWTEASEISAIELARRAAAAGCAGIIYTDIERDGMLAGANADSTAALVAAAECPVFASGGFASVGELASLAATGIAGVIICKAIYEGTIDLAEAVRSAAALA